MFLILLILLQLFISSDTNLSAGESFHFENITWSIQKKSNPSIHLIYYENTDNDDLDFKNSSENIPVSQLIAHLFNKTKIFITWLASQYQSSYLLPFQTDIPPPSLI